MSNFNCEICGALCTDSPTGYTTGCEHYPVDDYKGMDLQEEYNKMPDHLKTMMKVYIRQD